MLGYRMAEWKAKTNSLSYGGTPGLASFAFIFTFSIQLMLIK